MRAREIGELGASMFGNPWSIVPFDICNLR
jgi:hypothetical protein